MKKTVSVLILVSIALCMLSFAACGSSAVRLDKYVTFRAEGMEGAGRVTAVFDEKAFIRDHKNIKLTAEGKKNAAIKEMLDECTPAEMFCELCLSYSVSPAERLSNGDVVTLTWDVDHTLAAYFNCKVKASPVTYTVRTLTAVPAFDPFEDVSVSVSGVAPVFRYEILRGPNAPAEDGYCINASLEAENGVYTVVLTAETYSSPERFVEQYGKRMSATEKRFTVSSGTAAHYITSAAELPANALQTLHAMSEADFRAAETSHWVNPESFKGLSCVGTLTYLTKNTFLRADVSGGDGNTVFLVYKIDVEDAAGPFSYYYYTAVSNLIVNENGSVELPAAFSETVRPQGFFDETPYFVRGSLYYVGFGTLGELREHVARNHGWMDLTDDTLG